jgi:hypothetical protein
MQREYKKQNWRYVEIQLRDERLLRVIGDEGFIRRDLVIKYIFDGNESYAKIRIRKLKKFGFLNAVPVKAGDPECYLLGPEGVEVVRRFFPIGLRGWGCPSIQDAIDLGRYEHSCKVTEVRLLFENMQFCKNWKSERRLRAGTKGGHKVPDGFFVPNQKGVAVEVELRPKKASTYQKIFTFYEGDVQVGYVFYVCGTLPLLTFIRGITDKSAIFKKYCFLLYSELVESRENAVVRTDKGEFPLGRILG